LYTPLPSLGGCSGFALQKDADPNIPILKQAKAEYGKLSTAKGAIADIQQIVAELQWA